LAWDVLESADDAAVSDLEFQRELSPEQIREALSLLDGTAGAQDQNLRIGDLSRREQANPEPDQSRATMAAQDRPPAAEDPEQRKKHLNLAVAFFGIGIAAAGALTLLSWSESLHPPAMLVIPHEQPSTQSPWPPAKSDFSAPPIAKLPPDQSPGESEQQPSTPKLADSRPMEYVNRENDQATVRDAADSDRAIHPAARSAENLAIGTSQARWDERVSRKPEYAWRHARAVRVTAAKKRFWRPHWQARGVTNGAEWCFFACRTWQALRVFYEPPRNVTQ
jgi:hypothetical protein